MLGTASSASSHDHASVNSQLAKILESPHFRNSKRSQALLRFILESALSGDHSPLKERSIGAAVFGRDITYDTAQDPIVRNAAIEVRKRLAQYYLEPEHAGELRIDIPIGSYIPSFRVESPAAEPIKQAAPAFARAHQWMLVAAALALIGIAAAVLWTTRRTPASELEAFWDPVFRDGKTIQICIGQPTRLYRFTGPRIEELNRLLGAPSGPDRDTANLSISPAELTWVAPEYLFLRDAISAFNVASWLQSKGLSYQLTSVTATNYSQLRRAPLVAIGAFNNQWAMRVNAELRFAFSRRNDGGMVYDSIDDRHNPNGAQWRIAQPVTGTMTEDYAIVTHVFDPATENTVISAAGIETYGTLAASEFITRPEYVGAALRAAPKDWSRKNVQFVLGTKIIDGAPGPPRVLAAHFW